MLLSSYHHEENQGLKLGWCSFKSNEISIYDVASKTKQNPIHGTKLGGWGRNLLEYFPGLNYLVSATSQDSYCDFEVYDLNQPMKKIFCLGKTEGCIRDISYNERTQRAAIVSSPGSVSYCLFDCNSFTLLKKAEWPQMHLQVINTHDFDPEGRIFVTVDLNGDCFLTDVDTNAILCQFHFPTDVEEETTANNICRWKPKSSVFAVSFDNNKITLVDAEKQQAIRTKPLRVCEQVTNGIDWRKDGGLLITCSSGGELKMIDPRMKTTIRKFNEFDCEVESVKWSPSGEMVACSTWDGTVRIFDLASEKLIDEVKPQTGTAKSICFLNQ